MRAETFLKWLTAEICGLAGFFWGSLDGLLLALIGFMVIDYITGFLAGYRHLSSKTGFDGIRRKGVMLAVVAVGHILDTQIFGGSTSVCRSAVIGFYLANEGLSILENTARLGVPYPEKIKNLLEQLKEDKNDE